MKQPSQNKQTRSTILIIHYSLEAMTATEMTVCIIIHLFVHDSKNNNLDIDQIK